MARVKRTSFGAHVEGRGMVAPATRIFYVPTPKTACTSLKWALAEAEGSVGHRFHPTAVPTAEMTIHSSPVHGLKALKNLSGARRREVVESDDWIRFCVTRSPYERILSGWTQQVVLKPNSKAVWNDDDADDLGAAFRRFVAHLAEGGEMARDPHFIPMTDLLDVDNFPYTHVVDINDLSTFVESVRSQGGARERFRVDQGRNASLRLRADDMYDTETARLVEKIHRTDFDAFGYETRNFAAVPPVVTMSENERHLVQMVRDRELRVRAFHDDIFAWSHLRTLGSVMRIKMKVMAHRWKSK